MNKLDQQENKLGIGDHESEENYATTCVNTAYSCFCQIKEYLIDIQ